MCFEVGFEEAATCKISQYTELVEEAWGGGYQAEVVPVQVGSREVLEERGLERLRGILLPILSGNGENSF